MPFVLTTTHRYWWPVKVTSPDPNVPGAYTTEEFEAEFEPIGQDEAVALRAEILALPVEQQRAREHEELKRVTKNWRGVVNAGGTEMLFSADSFHQALQFSWFRAGMYAAYADSLSGEAARLGN